MSARRDVCRARLIIAEENENNDISFLLFQNKKWNTFVTVGGRVDKTDQGFDEAILRETSEETMNMIDISEILYKRGKTEVLEIQDRNERIKIYFLKIRMTDDMSLDKVFDDNREIILNNNKEDQVPYEWNEMISVSKFPLDNILSAIEGDYTGVMDLNGNFQEIYRPDLGYIKEGLDRKLFNGLDVITDYDVITNQTNSFLEGTRTIKLRG